MRAKVYTSNILRAWPRDAQENLFVRIEGWPDGVSSYHDELKASARRSRSALAMTERDAMLRPSGRKSAETIYVAALGVLAWDQRDLGRCLAAAAARGATVVALNTGRSIGPMAGAIELSAAQEDFSKDKRRGALMGEAGRLGHQAAKEWHDADTLHRIRLIEKDWGDPAFSTDTLLERAGGTTKRGAFRPMAWKTARKWLPDRRWLFRQKQGIKSAAKGSQHASE